MVGQSNRLVGIIWHHVPIAHYGSLFEKGQNYANNVAAMPSLHAAYALLIALYLWKMVPPWARVLLALYPPAMAFALVYSGEHYLVDCFAGWAYAVAAFVTRDCAWSFVKSGSASCTWLRISTSCMSLPRSA